MVKDKLYGAVSAFATSAVSESSCGERPSGQKHRTTTADRNESSRLSQEGPASRCFAHLGVRLFLFSFATTTYLSLRPPCLPVSERSMDESMGRSAARRRRRERTEILRRCALGRGKTSFGKGKMGAGKTRCVCVLAFACPCALRPRVPAGVCSCLGLRARDSVAVVLFLHERQREAPGGEICVLSWRGRSPLSVPPLQADPRSTRTPRRETSEAPPLFCPSSCSSALARSSPSPPSIQNPCPSAQRGTA